MLQSNLIYGIQAKIKENRALRKDQGNNGVLEEATTEATSNVVIETERAEPILESSFIADIYTKTNDAKKKEETQKALVTESFTYHKAEKKLSKDIAYFNYLYENFVPEVFKEQYQELVESIFNDTIKLYEECDVTPRLFTPALDVNDLTEASMVDLYRNSLNKTLRDEYTKPLLSGKITELYESEVRDFVKKAIQEEADVDIESVKIYLPFEESVYRFNKSILIPETASKPINMFFESLTEDVREFLQESPEQLLANLEKKIRLLTSMVAPQMFEKAVESENVDAPKMAGITITIDKNFGDADCEDDICPADVASDPEAAEEMADEAEAEAIEDENEDIVGAEEEVRDEMDLANDEEEYESAEADEEGGESAADETAEHPEQPGAVELDLDMEISDEIAPNNPADVELSKEQEGEVDPNGDSAQLPGGVPGDSAEQVDSDDLDFEDIADEGEEEIDPDDLLKTKEDVSSEEPDEDDLDEDEEKEDVSEGK